MAMGMAEQRCPQCGCPLGSKKPRELWQLLPAAISFARLIWDIGRQLIP